MDLPCDWEPFEIEAGINWSIEFANGVPEPRAVRSRAASLAAYGS